MKKINLIIIKFFSIFFLVLIVFALLTTKKTSAFDCDDVKPSFDLVEVSTRENMDLYKKAPSGGAQANGIAESILNDYDYLEAKLQGFANNNCSKVQYQLMYNDLLFLAVDINNLLNRGLEVSVTYPPTTKPTATKTPAATTTPKASASPATPGASPAASPAAPATSAAVTVPTPTYSQTDGIFGNNLSDFIKNLYGWSLGIGAGLAIIMLIYAGNLYASSMGNPDGATKAKELIVGAVAGLIFLLVAGLIYQAIKSPTSGDLNTAPSSTAAPTATP